MKALLFYLTLVTVLIAPMLHAADSTQKSGTSASTKPRYRFCTGEADPAGGCKFPGKGYTVCERLLKALNSLPADTPPPVCELKLPPGFEDIAQPNWEDMSVADNMHLVYDMEQYLIDYGQNRIPPEWQLYYPHDWRWKVDNANPETWRRVPYEIWLERFKKQMTAGEVVPRIRRTRMPLNAQGPETILAYDRLPGGDVGQCRNNLSAYEVADSGSHLFVLTDDPRRPIAPGYYSMSNRIALTFHATLYPVAIYVTGPEWQLSVNAAMPPLPVHLNADRWHYTMTQRCAFNLNK